MEPCPRCSCDAPDGARFCAACGAALEAAFGALEESAPGFRYSLAGQSVFGDLLGDRPPTRGAEQ